MIAQQLKDLKKVVHFLLYALVRNGYADTNLTKNGYRMKFEDFLNEVFTAAKTFEGLPPLELLMTDIMKLLHEKGNVVDHHSCGFMMHFDDLDPFNKFNREEFFAPKNHVFWNAWDLLRERWKQADKAAQIFVNDFEKKFHGAEATFAQASP